MKKTLKIVATVFGLLCLVGGLGSFGKDMGTAIFGVVFGLVCLLPVALPMLKRKKEVKNAPVKPPVSSTSQSVGRIVTKVAGVTFNNEDGSSRQDLLRYIHDNAIKDDISLDTYEYKGEPAVRVLYGNACIGNIPKEDVGRVMRVFEKINRATINVESFKKGGKEIYRADLTLSYPE